METETQKVSDELKADSEACFSPSSDVTHPTKNGRNTGFGKNLSPLRRLIRLRWIWVFNSFNTVILLGILFLLIIQLHWEKGNPVTMWIGTKWLKTSFVNSLLAKPLSPTESNNTVNESSSEQSASGGQKDSPARQMAGGREQSDETHLRDITETGHADIKKANELFEHKEYEQALTEYIKVANQSTPTTEQDLVQYRLGECYQKLGRLDDALAAYRNIVTGYFQSPYHVRATLREGECFIDKGDFLKARRLLFALVAQEGRYSDEDRGFVAEAYYKIAESYMKEALRYAHIQGYVFANEKQ